MDRAEKIDLIRNTGIIAIFRASSPERVIAAAGAIRRGGVRVIEVALNTPGALNIIAEASRELGDGMLFGAGTVLDPESARAVILAGAGFVVTPTLNLHVIELCHRYDIPVIPGCLAPTEMLTAYEAGADLVKLFPAEIGGPGLAKAILAPLPQLRIVPVGGVDLSNAAELIRNGATALGVGSGLVNQGLLDSGDYDELVRRLAMFIEQVKRARSC